MYPLAASDVVTAVVAAVAEAALLAAAAEVILTDLDLTLMGAPGWHEALDASLLLLLLISKTAVLFSGSEHNSPARS